LPFVDQNSFANSCSTNSRTFCSERAPLIPLLLKSSREINSASSGYSCRVSCESPRPNWPALQA
jgi:hypothetical protein